MTNFSDLFNTLKKRYLTFKTSNGCVYSLPVSTVAISKAKYYAKVDKVSLEESLVSTVKDFNSDDYAIEEWAKNSMDFKVEVSPFLKKISEALPLDMQKEWSDAEIEVR